MTPKANMTELDAAIEANRRWGHVAVTRDRGPDAVAPGRKRFMVGTIVHLARNNVAVHGDGETWEEAFAEADTRQEFLKPDLAIVAELNQVVEPFVKEGMNTATDNIVAYLLRLGDQGPNGPFLHRLAKHIKNVGPIELLNEWPPKV